MLRRVTALLGGYAYVSADDTGSVLSQYDTSSAGVGVGHAGPGRYEVKLPNVGLSTGDPAGNVQVTGGPGPGTAFTVTFQEIGRAHV